MNLVKLLKSLGDDTRLRIFNLLKNGPLCVCEIETILEISQSSASRHLSKLENAGLVTKNKNGQYVFFQLNEDTLSQHPFINTLIADGELESGQYKVDNERIAKIKKLDISCDDLNNGYKI